VAYTDDGTVSLAILRESGRSIAVHTTAVTVMSCRLALTECSRCSRHTLHRLVIDHRVHHLQRVPAACKRVSSALSFRWRRQWHNLSSFTRGAITKCLSVRPSGSAVRSTVHEYL